MLKNISFKILTQFFITPDNCRRVFWVTTRTCDYYKSVHVLCGELTAASDMLTFDELYESVIGVVC